MADQQCPICYCDYTAKSRKRIVCQYCPATACVLCLQTNILSTNAEPACYSCKREWNTEFMNTTFGVTFRTKTLRLHRRKTLIEREQGLLPSMQIYVGMKRRINEVAKILTDMGPSFTAHCKKYNELHSTRNMHRDILVPLNVKKEKTPLSAEETTTLANAEENFKKFSTEFEAYRVETYIPFSAKYHKINREYSLLQYRYRTGAQEGEKKEARREFIMRCPAADCRGFLSTAYKCGTCSKKTCAECTEIIEEDMEHTCKPESVESTKAIRKETRPCPKCAAPIYKIDGCDQMWCTNGNCNTAFSWITGQVVTGRVHNPHYYEWIRRTGGGTAPREVGDIPCGGIPAFQAFSQPFYSKYTRITSKVRGAIFDIHRHAVEIEEALPSYPQQAAALMNKEADVQYLMNDITEEVWVGILDREYTRFQKRRENGQILHTLVTATGDILRNVHMRMVEPEIQPDIPEWLESEILPTLETLRAYTNETFRKLGVANRCAVPQISERWQLLAPRTLFYKNQGPAAQSAAVANTIV
jgi:hypothetical protein